MDKHQQNSLGSISDIHKSGLGSVKDKLNTVSEEPAPRRTRGEIRQEIVKTLAICSHTTSEVASITRLKLPVALKFLNQLEATGDIKKMELDEVFWRLV